MLYQNELEPGKYYWVQAKLPLGAGTPAIAYVWGSEQLEFKVLSKRQLPNFDDYDWFCEFDMESPRKDFLEMKQRAEATLGLLTSERSPFKGKKRR